MHLEICNGTFIIISLCKQPYFLSFFFLSLFTKDRDNIRVTCSASNNIVRNLSDYGRYQFINLRSIIIIEILTDFLHAKLKVRKSQFV